MAADDYSMYVELSKDICCVEVRYQLQMNEDYRTLNSQSDVKIQGSLPNVY